jgi:hypothetical protein
VKTKQLFHEFGVNINEIKHETESFCNSVTGKIRDVEKASVNLQAKMKQVEARGQKNQVDFDRM